MTATGHFEVTTVPQAPDGEAAGPFARMFLDKKFHGALIATSRGQMVAFQCGVKGSAGYVAQEHVVGSLDGKRGSFVLQHSGLMKAGESVHWEVLVVPDSGTDELASISGRMTIVIEDGKHQYSLEYDLPS